MFLRVNMGVAFTLKIDFVLFLACNVICTPHAQCGMIYNIKIFAKKVWDLSALGLGKKTDFFSKKFINQGTQS